MTSLWDNLAADLADIFASSPSPAVDITYTPAGGDAIPCKAVIEPVEEGYQIVDDDRHNVAQRAVTVLISDISHPRPGDVLVLPDLASFAVESVPLLTSVFARLICEAQQMTRRGTPGSHLEMP